MKKSLDDTPLSRVLVGVPPHHEHYIVGATSGASKGCCAITLLNDGNGPMGRYDRVHVRLKDDRHLIFPAHYCTELEVIS
jgi:hypothetical protein